MIKKERNQEKKSTWFPSFVWILKVTAIIYVVIIVAFFSFNYLLKPYMRDIPKEITPWLYNGDI